VAYLFGVRALPRKAYLYFRYELESGFQDCMCFSVPGNRNLVWSKPKFSLSNCVVIDIKGKLFTSKDYIFSIGKMRYVLLSLVVNITTSTSTMYIFPNMSLMENLFEKPCKCVYVATLRIYQFRINKMK